MKKIFRYVLLLILGILFISPILFAILVSFIPNTAFILGQLLPKNFDFSNYIKAIKEVHLPWFMLNSTISSIFIVSGQIFLASLAAYAFVFIEFKSRHILFGLFLATMMVPFEATFISNFQTIKYIGLLDTHIGLALPFLASAFAIFYLRQTFRQIPYELFETAQISGLTHFKFYMRVVLPMTKKSITTLGVYLFLSAWNMYLWPLITSTNNRVRTVQIGLRQLQSYETLTQWGTIMAAAILIIIPTLIVLYLTQNRLQEGFAEGAIK